MIASEQQTVGPFGHLDEIPRKILLHRVTPIEEMPFLAKHLGTAGLFVKRDDCTDLAFGGNKVRQLEFYLGEAERQGADTILITGAVQSNFMRLAAAAARKCGMTCHIQMEERVPKSGAYYRQSGNVLLDKLLGVTLHSYPDGEDEAGADRRLHDMADELRSTGATPYIIPLAPGHVPLGALGYVVAAREILAQATELNIELDDIVVASGSGHTHSGLLFGVKALGWPGRVHGICARRSADQQRLRIETRVSEIADLLGTTNPVMAEDIILDDRFLAPGYGLLNPAARAAMKLSAESEALLLDPVYTAKAMAGFIDLVRNGASERNSLVIHTGGTPAIFAYGDDLIAS